MQNNPEYTLKPIYYWTNHKYIALNLTMKINIIFLLTFLSINLSAQSFPIHCTFAKMYIGEYDLSQHKTTSLQLSDIDFVDVDFDGKSLFTAIYRSRQQTDTLTLSLIRESETRGDDYVEYKFISPDGFMIFLWYNLYGVPGIRELSIFHPDKTKFFYIKRKTDAPTK